LLVLAGSACATGHDGPNSQEPKLSKEPATEPVSASIDAQSDDGQGAVDDGQGAVGDARPVLVTLETGRERLTVHSTSDGPRYSVTTAAGRLVARNLDAIELAEHHPELSDLLRSGTARGPYLDARFVDSPAGDEHR
jgi:hypothetical protein